MNTSKNKTIDTGFKELNRMTGGWKAGQLIVIAGRPAMGKSTLAINLAENAASTRVPTAILCMEMPYLEICNRKSSRHETTRFRSLKNNLFSDYSSAAPAESVYISDTMSMDIGDLRQELSAAVSRMGVGLAVVDYFGLIDKKDADINSISQGLKQTAKDLDIPIIVVAQLNRVFEDRPGNRPQMSDLGDSGSLEQYADIIGFLYRESYYDRSEEVMEAKAAQLNMSITEYQQKAELIIAKHRNGPVGSISLRFTPEKYCFNEA